MNMFACAITETAVDMSCDNNLGGIINRCICHYAGDGEINPVSRYNYQ